MRKIKVKNYLKTLNSSIGVLFVDKNYRELFYIKINDIENLSDYINPNFIEEYEIIDVKENCQSYRYPNYTTMVRIQKIKKKEKEIIGLA